MGCREPASLPRGSVIAGSKLDQKLVHAPPTAFIFNLLHCLISKDRYIISFTESSLWLAAAMPVLASRAAIRSIQPLALHTRSRLFTGHAKSNVQPSRLRKYTRRAAYATVGLGTLWAIDRSYNASAVSRNLRTLWTVRYEFTYLHAPR